MSCFHSIRWRLQFWHGGLLILVLAGFGFTAWRLQRTHHFNRVDHELEQRMGMIAGLVQPGRDGGGRASAPPLPGRAPLRLPLREREAFEGLPGQAFYYVIWGRNDEPWAHSSAAPNDVPLPLMNQGPPAFRLRETCRECFHKLPSGESILIGRDIRFECAQIQQFAWLLFGAGAVVLGFGLVGGWWISTRALRPLGEISAVAAKIAQGDLTQRILLKNDGSEIGALARDLNNTFARLQASFMRQAQFTADAAHELRTPLTVMLTQTQSALLRERSGEEYRESLAACQRAAQRMRSLAENLLMLARLDTPDASTEFSTCMLDLIAREAVELVRPLAGELGVRVETELAPAPCHGNADQLAQVMANLLANAIHYNHPGGCVRVLVTSEPDAATIVVSDTGQGIHSEDIPHIFERFYRADKTRSSANNCSGLGLAIVKAIVDAHDGSIEVQSVVGQGSAFHVRLPR